ncbi:hypothetical protein R5W23_004021 [Gemmata sp. JC673]|uniref:Uncharacterized protein n=1 Tax=Gemmata algarum TaxID=2975278 RepID=A0ABU5F4Q1_9BACT|nr:hypothetical protein [Gemmata algarum]MDY3562555.1 hypothetical protein [Gemmata algarum]
MPMVRESIIREAILAAVICAAGIPAHLLWGVKETGPGRAELLTFVAVTSLFCATLFLLSSGTVAWVLRQNNRPAHSAADLGLFAIWCSLTVWGGVTTRFLD